MERKKINQMTIEELKKLKKRMNSYLFVMVIASMPLGLVCLLAVCYGKNPLVSFFIFFAFVTITVMVEKRKNKIQRRIVFLVNLEQQLQILKKNRKIVPITSARRYGRKTDRTDREAR